MDSENIIYRYTRQNGIDDGILIDITEQARETGILLPTVVTAQLHHVLEQIPEWSVGQDYRGRLHDVLWMTFLKLKAMKAKSEEDFPTEVDVIIDGQKHTLWVVIDGDGLTIMYPDDY